MVLYHNASTVPCTPIPPICFPSFCGGAVGTFPPCLLLPHQLQVVLWSRVKIHWSAQRLPGKGRDPENYSEYIFLLSLHEQREICHETMLNVLGRRTCSPQGLSAQWGVFAHPDFAVAVGTSTYLPAWELTADQHDFSTISSPPNSPENLFLLINGSISAAHSLSHFFFAHSPYRPEMWWFSARYFYLFLTWMALRTFVYDLAWGPYLVNVFLWPLGTKSHFLGLNPISFCLSL